MSKSSTATKLPSQVAKIGKDAEALAEETGIKSGSKPLKPVESVETHSAAIKNEPAKIDPDDYKERYSRYKATTDTTISELRQELAGVNQKIAAQEATITELRTQVAQKQTVTSVPEKSLAGTKDDPAFKKWLNDLPEHIKTEYQEDYLFDQFTIQASLAPKQAGPSKSEDLAALENKIDNVVQFQEKTKNELYEDAMDAAFPNDEWITLASGQEWTDYCNQRVSEVDPRTYGQIVKQGSDSHTATTVIWVLKQYKQHLSTLEAANTVVADPLESQLTPEGAGGGGGDPITEINAQAETFTQSQVEQFFTDCATTKKYTHEEAAAIEKQIMAAQAAGKIIPG